MDDINISGADFGSSLPKWATDETLKRLYKLVETDSNRDKREQQKLLTLLGKMNTNSANAATQNKQIANELKEIKKAITSGNSSSSKVDAINNSHNKALERLMKDVNTNLQKINNENKSNNAKQQNAASSSKANSNNGTANRINEKGYANIERAVDRLNKNMTAVLGKNGTIGGGSFKSRVEESLATRSKTGDDESWKNILDRLTKGRISKVENVMTNTTAGKTTVAAAKMAGGMAKAAAGLVKFVPVIGSLVTVFSTLAGIVSATADIMKYYSWDAQKEYKAMLKSGFSFTKEAGKGMKMDAIRLHTMINKSGMLITEGMAVMEKNAVLFNNIGVEEVFATIAGVADAQDENGRSFQDAMMLSRQEIGEFTTQYLASTMNILGSEKRREEDRRKAATRFIADTKLFGQVTGQSMQVIIDKMSALRDTDEYRIAQAVRDANGNEVLDVATTFFNSLQIDDGLKDILTKAAMNTTGAGLAAVDGGAELRAALSMAGGDEMANKLDELMRDMQLGKVSADDVKARSADFLEFVQSSEMNKRNLDAIYKSNDQAFIRVIGLIKGFQQTDYKKLRNGGVDADISETTANKQQELESEIAKSRNMLEGTKLVGVEMARSTIDSGLEALKGVTAIAADITNSLLLKILEGIGELTKWIKSMFVSIKNKFNFFGSDEEDARDDIIKSIKGSKIASKAADLSKMIISESGAEYANKNAKVLRIGNTSANEEKMAKHANTLIDEMLNGNAESQEKLKTILSSDLPSSVKDAYEDTLRKRMEADINAQEDIIKALNATRKVDPNQPVDTTSQVKETVNNTATSIENKDEVKPTTSPIKAEAEQIRQQQEKAQEMKREEENRVAAEKQRVAQEAEAKKASAAANAGSVANNEAATTTVPVAKQQGENVQSIAGINTLIEKVDELIRAQKEFNSNMVIQIIKA